jgi:thiol-disulfide isomerase/thioredoxin
MKIYSFTLSQWVFLLGSVVCILTCAMALQPVTRSSPSSTTQRYFRPSMDPPCETTSPLPSLAEIQATIPKRRSMQLIHTLDDFYSIIEQCRKENEIAMVFWSASWCRSCHRLQPQLQQLIQRSTDRPIRFLQIANPQYSLSQHRPQGDGSQNLHALFGIRTVPFCHIYHPHYGLVEERKLTPSSSQRNAITVVQLDRLLQSYEQGSCSLEEEDNAQSKVAPS